MSLVELDKIIKPTTATNNNQIIRGDELYYRER